MLAPTFLMYISCVTGSVVTSCSLPWMKSVHIVGCKVTDVDEPGDFHSTFSTKKNIELESSAENVVDEQTTAESSQPEYYAEEDLDSFVNALMDLYQSHRFHDVKDSILLHITVTDEVTGKRTIFPSPTVTSHDEVSQQKDTEKDESEFPEFTLRTIFPSPTVTSHDEVSQQKDTENDESQFPEFTLQPSFTEYFSPSIDAKNIQDDSTIKANYLYGLSSHNVEKVMTCLVDAGVSVAAEPMEFTTKDITLDLTEPLTTRLQRTSSVTTPSTTTKSNADNETKDKKPTAPPVVRVTSSTTQRPALPVDRVTPCHQQNPHLPIAHPSTSTARPRHMSMRKPRIIWNATLTQFPDPDDRNTLVWGLVISVSVSVLGLSIGLVCYCHYKHGGLRITLRGTVTYNRGAGTIENMGAEGILLSEVKTNVENIGSQMSTNRKKKTRCFKHHLKHNMKQQDDAVPHQLLQKEQVAVLHQKKLN